MKIYSRTLFLYFILVQLISQSIPVKSVYAFTETDSNEIIEIQNKGLSKQEIEFIDINLLGYTIPICSDKGKKLEFHSVEEEAQYLGDYKFHVSGKTHLGRISSSGITCKAIEYRTKRSNHTDFALFWIEFLNNFGGSYEIIGGRHASAYAMYRLVYPDKYIQYISVYPHSSGAIVLSTGAMPTEESWIREILIIMMGESGLLPPER